MTKTQAWILSGLLLTVCFGFYWGFSSSKITVYPNRPLIWKDFKQVKIIGGREGINATCISTTDFEIIRTFDEGKYKRIELSGKIKLHEELSQVSLNFLSRANKATKEQVLHHENGHFKIAQIIGRRIVGTVDAFLFDPKDFKKQLDSIINSHYKDWSLMDREYDQATTNPRNQEKQKEWDGLFKRELKGSK